MDKSMKFLWAMASSSQTVTVSHYQRVTSQNMGVSENSVSLNPMVLLIIIPMKNGYFIGNIPYFQTNPYIYIYIMGMGQN